METHEFETKALQFWHEIQLKALKEGGTDPVVLLFADDADPIRIDKMPPLGESPLTPLVAVVRLFQQIRPFHAVAVVCEGWGVHNDANSPDPVVKDHELSKELAKARRLEIHPLRKEVLLVLLVQPDRIEVRQKEMLRDPEGKLIGYGAEVTLDGKDGTHFEGNIANVQKYLAK